MESEIGKELTEEEDIALAKLMDDIFLSGTTGILLLGYIILAIYWRQSIFNFFGRCRICCRILRGREVENTEVS